MIQKVTLLLVLGVLIAETLISVSAEDPSDAPVTGNLLVNDIEKELRLLDDAFQKAVKVIIEHLDNDPKLKPLLDSLDKVYRWFRKEIENLADLGEITAEKIQSDPNYIALKEALEAEANAVGDQLKNVTDILRAFFDVITNLTPRQTLNEPDLGAIQDFNSLNSRFANNRK